MIDMTTMTMAKGDKVPIKMIIRITKTIKIMNRWMDHKTIIQKGPDNNQKIKIKETINR